MLQPNKQQNIRRELAYPVPFFVDRSHAPRFRIRNIGPETVYGVSFTLIGSGVMQATPPSTLRPGQETTVQLFAQDLQSRSTLLVRWFRQNSVEYLWRVSF